MGPVLDWLNCKQLIFLCIASVQNKKNQISGKSRWNVWLELKLSNPSSGGRAGQAGTTRTLAKGSFSWQAAPNFNRIPVNISETLSLDVFKNKLKDPGNYPKTS